VKPDDPLAGTLEKEEKKNRKIPSLAGCTPVFKIPTWGPGGRGRRARGGGKKFTFDVSGEEKKNKQKRTRGKPKWFPEKCHTPSYALRGTGPKVFGTGGGTVTEVENGGTRKKTWGGEKKETQKPGIPCGGQKNKGSLPPRTGASPKGRYKKEKQKAR